MFELKGLSKAGSQIIVNAVFAVWAMDCPHKGKNEISFVAIQGGTISIYFVFPMGARATGVQDMNTGEVAHRDKTEGFDPPPHRQ